MGLSQTSALLLLAVGVYIAEVYSNRGNNKSGIINNVYEEKITL